MHAPCRALTPLLHLNLMPMHMKRTLFSTAMQQQLANGSAGVRPYTTACCAGLFMGGLPCRCRRSLAGSGWRGGAHNALLRWSKGQQEMPLHTAACMPSRLQPGSLGPTHSLHCHPPCVALPNPALTVVPRCSTSAPPNSRSAPVWRVSTWRLVGEEAGMRRHCELDTLRTALPPASYNAHEHVC